MFVAPKNSVFIQKEDNTECKMSILKMLFNTVHLLLDIIKFHENARWSPSFLVAYAVGRKTILQHCNKMWTMQGQTGKFKMVEEQAGRGCLAQMAQVFVLLHHCSWLLSLWADKPLSLWNHQFKEGLLCWGWRCQALNKDPGVISYLNSAWLTPRARNEDQNNHQDSADHCEEYPDIIVRLLETDKRCLKALFFGVGKCLTTRMT